jgi:hypothetical protein
MDKTILPQQAININSSAVKSASYDYEMRKLRLTYQSDNSYNYAEVPVHVFEGLRTSNSKGKFINKYVLNKYSFKRA